MVSWAVNTEVSKILGNMAMTRHDPRALGNQSQAPPTVESVHPQKIPYPVPCCKAKFTFNSVFSSDKHRVESKHLLSS